MPSKLILETVIERGFRCNQTLRAFFEKEIGPKFHFNQAMRDFISRDGVGKTLKEAIDVWFASQNSKETKKEIAGQFEYNRFIRDYFANNQGVTRQEAINAWWEYRSKRRSS